MICFSFNLFISVGPQFGFSSVANAVNRLFSFQILNAEIFNKDNLTENLVNQIFQTTNIETLKKTTLHVGTILFAHPRFLWTENGSLSIAARSKALDFKFYSCLFSWNQIEIEPRFKCDTSLLDAILIGPIVEPYNKKEVDVWLTENKDLNFFKKLDEIVFYVQNVQYKYYLLRKE